MPKSATRALFLLGSLPRGRCTAENLRCRSRCAKHPFRCSSSRGKHLQRLQETLQLFPAAICWLQILALYRVQQLHVGTLFLPFIPRFRSRVRARQESWRRSGIPRQGSGSSRPQLLNTRPAPELGLTRAHARGGQRAPNPSRAVWLAALNVKLHNSDKQRLVL